MLIKAVTLRIWQWHAAIMISSNELIKYILDRSIACHPQVIHEKAEVCHIVELNSLAIWRFGSDETWIASVSRVLIMYASGLGGGGQYFCLCITIISYEFNFAQRWNFGLRFSCTNTVWPGGVSQAMLEVRLCITISSNEFNSMIWRSVAL